VAVGARTLILLGRGVGAGILERAGVRREACEEVEWVAGDEAAADEAVDAVRVRKPETGGRGDVGTGVDPELEAARIFVLDGNRLRAGLG
jgi:hypothetical protein